MAVYSRHLLRASGAFGAVGFISTMRPRDVYCEEPWSDRQLPGRIDKWRRSAAQLYNKDPMQRSSKYLGSAFALDRTFLVTAAHVLDNHTGGPVSIKLGDGSCHIGTLHGISTLIDLAVIRVHGAMESETAEWAERRPQAGEQCLVLGTPNYATDCISVCGQIVSNRQTFPDLDEAPECPVPLLLLSVPTVPGMSGSILLHPESGRIQGVMVKKFLEFGIALPVDVVRQVVGAFQESGVWEPRRLGMSINNDMTVTSVEVGTLAFHVGFQPRDRILAINGTPNPAMSTFMELLWFGNCAIDVEIQRLDQHVFMTIPAPS